jgi:hypothetical protein
VSSMTSSWIRSVLLAVSIAFQWGCGVPGEPEPPADVQESPRQRAERLLSTLAADSMEGRRTGSPGALRAATFIADQLAAYGVEPAGEDGYFQRVPLVPVERRGRQRLSLGSLDDLEDGTTDDVVIGRNVLGMVRGSDSSLVEQVVVVGAHFDHLGVGDDVDGDSIYNGADDDASGVVAVLEAARALATGPSPRRTVVFALFTGEEMGLLGTRFYLDHPTVPLERTIAELQVEMIGRPDPITGGPGRLWLTGFERSTIGDLLVEAGIPVVPDPRPEYNFFQRSDNYPFAMLGIPAHTLSSYNLHEDYHQPSDDIDHIDFDHMVAAIEVTVDAVRALADADEPPGWNEDGQP